MILIKADNGFSQNRCCAKKWCAKMVRENDAREQDAMTDLAIKTTAGIRTSPTLARRALMNTLDRLQVEHGLKPAEISIRTGTPVQTVRRWLNGGNLDIKPAQVITLMGAYGYSADHDLTQRLVRYAMAAKQRGVTQPRQPWMERYGFNEYIGFEQGASRITNVETSIVPGLLQTEAYAAAIIRGNELQSIEDEDVAQRVAVRMQRQQILRTAEDPLELVAVLDETALHRGPADPAVMRGQLEHLRDVAGWPNVELMIVPFSAGFSITGETGSFVLMEFSEDDLPEIAYSETPLSGVWAEGDGIAQYRAVITHLSARAVVGTAAVGMITEALRTL